MAIELTDLVNNSEAEGLARAPCRLLGQNGGHMDGLDGKVAAITRKRLESAT